MKISDPNEKGAPYPIKSLVRDIWVESGQRRGKLISGTIFRILSDIISLYPAYAFALIITKITTGTANKQNILFILTLCLIAYIARYFFVFFAKRNIFYVGNAIWLSIEKKMLKILISKDSAWHEKETSGVKLKRLERGSISYRDALAAFVNTYIETFISLVGIPFIIFKFEKTIGIIMVIFIIVYFLISKYLQKNCIDAAHKFNVEEEKLGGQVFETVNHIRTINVLNISDKIMGKVNSFINSSLFAVGNRIRRFQFRNHFMSGFSQSVKVIIVLFITYSVLKGNYEVGFIVLFISYFEKIWEMIREVTDVGQDVLVARQSIARMHSLIGVEEKFDRATKDFPKTWSNLSIENLSFSYGDNIALQNISFSVKRGEKVGIVGLSGAGKSTLFKLLVRERGDYTGDIKIDEISINEIKKQSFYENVSIVLQDTEVFNFSLRENIEISSTKEKNNERLFEKSISVSHVKDFVKKLQNGVDTLIGEKGIKLSGGEKQRLGIARAIYKEPEILLLDEATSHLDLESEEKIQDSLQKFFKDVTAIVIAHRLTTIKEMDKIIVIEHGTIEEQGSFDELMNRKGRFFELWQKQLI